MRKPLVPASLAIVPLLLAAPLAAAPFAAQRIETVDGVRVVHNEKGGVWGKAPRVALELVRKIGDIDTEDENVAFNYPADVAVDKDGNIHVLDAANARIQKFGPDGEFLATIGRKGQGPGEFIFPDAIGFDKDGNLVVADSAQNRVHVIIDGGRDVRSIVVKEELVRNVRPLASGDYAAQGSTYAFPRPGQPAKKPEEMRLFRRIGADGRTVGSFGQLTDFGETMTTAVGNGAAFDVDGGDSIYVSFSAQNRIEKYAPDGSLVWRADRPLNYGTEVRKKGKIDTSGGGFSSSAPEMNSCSVGIAVDGRKRSWVVTYDRQLRKEERVQTTMTMVGGRGGVSAASVKTEGNTDLRTTDAFKLEIFDADGVLLGEIPLAHFADVVRVAGDSLVLIDRERGVSVYQYRIVEK
ncbi:MAG TPA: NHL repeat-containing protein [Candidatus Aminicenantes bacterium]|nr:NHL repeat-containing protein [Candidatus Aminicenantes bacterium]